MVFPLRAEAQSGSLTAATATAHFAEAETVSNADGGRHWGVPLYGPMLFVDETTRRVIANESSAGLEADGGVFIGTLPEDVGIANTAATWNGKKWTMLMWPLPEDAHRRRAPARSRSRTRHLQPGGALRLAAR